MLLDTLSHPFAFLDFDYRTLVSIVLPLAGIVLAGVVAVSAMYFQNRRREMWHETARLALEKGQPMPPFEDEQTEEESGDRSRDRTVEQDVRRGLVLIAVGAGLWFMLGAIAGQLRYVGAIPGFIGVALLLYASLRTLTAMKSKSDSLPPRT